MDEATTEGSSELPLDSGPVSDEEIAAASDKLFQELGNEDRRNLTPGFPPIDAGPAGKKPPS